MAGSSSPDTLLSWSGRFSSSTQSWASERSDATGEGAMVEGPVPVGGWDRIHAEVDQSLYWSHRRARSVGSMGGVVLLAALRAA